MRISLIAAMTPARLIGNAGRLPWHKPEDLRHFRRLTTGHTVLMGRKTYESVGRPLPNRRNIVLTRHGLPGPPAGLHIAATLEQGLEFAAAADESELFIVGGAQIYALAFPLAHRMYLTFVHLPREPAGDTWFPQWDPADWVTVDSRTADDLEFVCLDRRPQPSGHNAGLTG